MFTLNNPVKLIFGGNSLRKISSAARTLGNKALIVTGQNSARKYGFLQQTIELLNKAGIKSIPFEKVTPNPLSTTVMEGVNTVKKEDCDLVVGLGGGSTMDTAKAIALTVVNDGNITDYQPGGKYEDKEPQEALPIIAITTTAGTGSEINRYLVITNADTNEKPGIGYECTYPALSIVDPELMTTLPEDITADTGVDVLFHAMEAFLSNNANMYSQLIAKEAIKLTVDNLEKALKDGSNIEARTKMAWANTLAGQAIDIAGTIAIHASGHPLSGNYDLTHAQTLAALGVTHFEQNYEANPKKFATLARLLGYKGDKLSTGKLAAKSPVALANYLETVNRNIKLGILVDIDQNDVKKLARDALKTMGGAIENNPKDLSVKDVEELYRKALQK